MTPEIFLRAALEEAKKAASLGEIPVGAVIVRAGKIIASAHNLREKNQNALHHAEVLAIDAACKTLGTWRLSDCDLYVTLEPCPMCAGAIVNARLRTVCYGAKDPKAGCMGSLCDITALPFNHRPQVISGLLEEECAALLSDFFENLRKKKTEEALPVALRPFAAEDADILKQYLFSRRKKENICTLIKEWETSSETVLAVTAADSPVGYGKIIPHSAHSATLELCIFSDFRGKGYGSEGLLLLRDFGIEQGFSTLNAHPRHGHVPSEKVCRRAGFVFLGLSVTPKGQTLSDYLYTNPKNR